MSSINFVLLLYRQDREFYKFIMDMHSQLIMRCSNNSFIQWKKTIRQQKAVYTSISNMVSWETSLTEFTGQYLHQYERMISSIYFIVCHQTVHHLHEKKQKFFVFFFGTNARKSLGSKGIRQLYSLINESHVSWRSNFGHDYQNSQAVTIAHSGHITS